ncbi:MgtC/SapB family protein [Bacillus sp. Bva_UNVM-123]|uniref:MgtC/SapB family protein n=1 Tax=Bacillus sp. Bva_UNVM-123 TaxID=2829798 RepID=UPI00391F4FED
MNHLELEVLMKLGISAILGLVIGIERELRRKPVGLKTSLVIAIVSCLLTIVSIKSAYVFPGKEGVQITIDPLRLAAQIVSGIGFLGAGVILRRGNDSISGLTTAALIWGAAGIGIAVGAGFYIEAMTGVALLIISVEVIPMFIKLVGPRQLREREVTLQLKVSSKENIEDILSAVKDLKISIIRVRIKDIEEQKYLIQLIVTTSHKKSITDIYYSVSELSGVRSVEIESMQ